MAELVAFPKALDRKVLRVRKKTPFRFDPVPSLLIEEWLPHLNLPELRVLLYICRRTWGFRKQWDAISIEQFCNGVRNRDGKQVDSGTGFKRSHVKNTLAGLESRGLIAVQHRKTRANLYSLTIKPVATMSDQQPDSACHSV